MPRLLKAWCCGVYAFLYLPMAVMFVFSFNKARRNVAWTGFTLEWYGKLAGNEQILAALLTSLRLALVVTAVTAALATLASYALARHPAFRGRAAYAGLLNVPLLMPEVILGVGLLSFFVRSRITLSFWTMVAGHVVFCLPYAVGVVRARLVSLRGPGLEEAAMDLGATPWQAFAKVTLPLAAPAIAAGALLAFTVSLEDYVTTFFVKGRGLVTLPLQIYSMMKFGVTPEVNALAVVIIGFTLAVLASLHLAGGRISGRAADYPRG